MKSLVRRILDRTPYVGPLRKRVRELGRQISDMKQAEGQFHAGHYYSPVPSAAQVKEHLNSPFDESELEDIDLNSDEMAEILKKFETFYDEMPFPEEKSPDFRYYFAQTMFVCPDAVFLFCFLRHVRPKRIIEAGSGFSSAIILDTVDRYFDPKPDITLIEPDPARLKQLLKPGDEEKCNLIPSRVQTLSPEIFDSLLPGDLLFIDSSHVVSAGSDVQFLFSKVLPRLKPGVFVHIHDVVYPFTYPVEWLKSGRYWNEAYFLRAFLAYNSSWEIYWFNSYAAKQFRTSLAKNMPLALKGEGGSIYIRRV